MPHNHKIMRPDPHLQHGYGSAGSSTPPPSSCSAASSVSPPPPGEREEREGRNRDRDDNEGSENGATARDDSQDGAGDNATTDKGTQIKRKRIGWIVRGQGPPNLLEQQKEKEAIRFASVVGGDVLDVPSLPHMTVSLYLCSSGSNAQGKSRARKERCVSSKSPSRV